MSRAEGSLSRTADQHQACSKIPQFCVRDPSAFLIENIGGADGSIGAGRAARAKPDGYTIDIGYLGNHVLNGAF